jgi:hypothetical protein
MIYLLDTNDVSELRTSCRYEELLGRFPTINLDSLSDDAVEELLVGLDRVADGWSARTPT